MYIWSMRVPSHLDATATAAKPHNGGRWTTVSNPALLRVLMLNALCEPEFPWLLFTDE